jgi:hypothetical protein
LNLGGAFLYAAEKAIKRKLGNRYVKIKEVNAL